MSRSIVVTAAGKVYGRDEARVAALDGVSLSVEAGEFVSLLGPSGCGKSTLLWAIAGLKPLDRGSIALGEERIARPHPDISIIFQEPTLLPWRSVARNISFPLEIRRDWNAEARRRVDALVERVGLKGFEDRFPRELSGGMQQRASIVRGLASDPEVLLLDEPFSALDPFTREDMNMLLQSLWSDTGKTMILVTHSIEEALLLSDRVCVMTPRPGRVRREIRVDLPRPRTPEVLTSPAFFELAGEVRRELAH